MADRSLRPGLKVDGARLYSGRRVITENRRASVLTDPYHTALTLSWPRFLLWVAAWFVVINCVFAALYSLGRDPIANARPGDFADMFFFSIETSSTTGYGDMHPQTLYGHAVSAVEIFVSLLATAAVTGLVFARFSRPRARLLFAHHPVVTTHNGVRTLMVRIVNARTSYISEATAKLWLLGPIESAEGRRYTGFTPMPLVKSENPSFALSWTLFHPIDAASPLYGKSAQDTVAEDVNVVVSIVGLDESSMQTVHTRHVYGCRDLRWDYEFVDMFYDDSQGRLHVDFSKVHDIKTSQA